MNPELTLVTVKYRRMDSRGLLRVRDGILTALAEATEKGSNLDGLMERLIIVNLILKERKGG